MTVLVYQRATNLLEASLGDELVGLDVDAGNCFGFNVVATEVWRLLANPKSFEDLKAALLVDYAVDDEQCTKDLSAYLDSLVNYGLIRKTGHSENQA